MTHCTWLRDRLAVVGPTSHHKALPHDPSRTRPHHAAPREQGPRHQAALDPNWACGQAPHPWPLFDPCTDSWPLYLPHVLSHTHQPT